MITRGMPTTPTFYEGLLQVVSGVSDLHLLYDAPDCIMEQTESVGVQHDLRSSILGPRGRSRASSTHLLDNDLVLGTSERLRTCVREISGGGRIGMLLVGQSSLPHISGTDSEAIASDLSEETGIVIAAVRSAPLSGGYVDGFRCASEAIARRLPLAKPSAEPFGVALIGYPLSRLEQDDLANISELKRICEGIGAPVRSLWFDGGSVAGLSAAADAAHFVSLPWGGQTARILGERIGRPVVETGVPVGLDGTVQWIRSLASAIGRTEMAEAFIERELDEAVSTLEWAIPRGLMHRCVGIAADPLLAAALVECMAEMGVQIRSVDVLARVDSEADPVRRALEAARQTAFVQVDSPFGVIEALWAEQAASGDLDLVIGTSAVRDAVPAGTPFLGSLATRPTCAMPSTRPRGGDFAERSGLPTRSTTPLRPRATRAERSRV